MHPKPLILASGSVYRAQALRDAGLAFTQVSPDVDEQAIMRSASLGKAQINPGELSCKLAATKCLKVASNHPAATVIGSDQVGYCNGLMLTKPGARAAAIEQLQHCQGNAACFYTSVAVTWPGLDGPRIHTVTTDLEFRPLSHDEIEAYVDLDEPFDCAGAFKIEAHGVHLFTSVRSSDPSALIGLPMLKTLECLRAAGINPLIR